MKLYNWHVAPNPRRVRMFIVEKGLDIEIVEVGEPGQPKLNDAFLSTNLHRLVPALELDDGTLLGEAPVICRYLDSVFPEPPLLGRDPKERAVVDMWDRKCELEGMQACAEILRNKVKGFAGRGLPGYTVRIDQIDQLVARGLVRVGAFYAKLDARLGESAFLAGADFTGADITGFVSVEMARQGKNGIPDECANVKRWHEAISARDSATA